MMVVEDLLSILLLAMLTGVATGAGVSAGELARTLASSAASSSRWSSSACSIVPRAIRYVARFERAEHARRGEPRRVLRDGVARASAPGYSVALGAFVAGMLIAESGKGHDVDALVRPFRDIVRRDLLRLDRHDDRTGGGRPTTGSPRSSSRSCSWSCKTIGVSVAAFLTGNGLRRSVQAGLALSQIGEFSFIVGRDRRSRPASCAPFLLPIVVGASCITAMTGSCRFALRRRVASWLDRTCQVRSRRSCRSTTRGSRDCAASRAPDRSWRRLRRPLTLLVIDGVLVAAIVIGAAAAHRAITHWLAARADVDERSRSLLLVAVTVAIVGLFALGIARGAVRMAWLLATRGHPEHQRSATRSRRHAARSCSRSSSRSCS